jgi:DUF4097 and DUF4098 domain-containing protein YvlB
MRLLLPLLLVSLGPAVSVAAQGLDRRLIPAYPESAMTAAVQDRRGPEQTDRFSRQVRLGANGRISLSNGSGSIVVTGGSGDDVSIEAVKRTRGDRRLLDSVHIQVDERAGRITIRTVRDDPGRDRREGVAVDYVLTIPSQSAIEIKSASGPIRVSNVKGVISAEAASGSVTISGASRVELARSLSGNVEVSDSTLDDGLFAETMSGAVRVHDVKAPMLRLKSVSGRVETAALACDRIEMQSISGRLEFAGRLSRNGRYNLTAHSGSIHVTVADEAGFDLDANTLSGSIRSDLPGLRLEPTNRDSRGRRIGRSMRGTFGDGSATLTVRTFSGSISIDKR